MLTEQLWETITSNQQRQINYNATETLRNIKFGSQFWPGQKLEKHGNVRNLGSFFRLFLFWLFDFGPISHNRKLGRRKPRKQIPTFPSFRFTTLQFNFQFRQFWGFFKLYWFFWGFFLTLFEFVILGYWTAIIQHANLCSKSHN